MFRANYKLEENHSCFLMMIFMLMLFLLHSTQSEIRVMKFAQHTIDSGAAFNSINTTSMGECMVNCANIHQCIAATYNDGKFITSSVP